MRTVNAGRPASRHAWFSPWTNASAASGIFAASGSAHIQSDSAARPPRHASAPHSSREGLQSMSVLDDSLDKGLQLRVFGLFAAHAPLPQLIVFAVEQT